MFHTSALTLFLTSLGTSSLGRIEKKLDELAAEIRKGQHEPSLSNLCDEGNPAEQENAWHLLMSELAEDFSKGEIESHRDDIKTYVHRLIKRGQLDEEESSEMGALEHARPAGAICSPGSKSEEISFVRSDSSQSRLPPSSTVESDVDSVYSIVTRRIDDCAKMMEADALLDSSNNRRVDDIEKPADGEFDPLESPDNQTVVNTTENQLPSIIPQKSNQKKTVSVGIDLNADYCRVAAFDEETQDAVLLNNEHGKSCTPAFVAFTEKDILVGEDAKNQAPENAENTFFNFTLLLGSSFDDKSTSAVANNSPFQIDIIYGKPTLSVPCRQRHYSPEELTAFLIKEMVRIAEVSLRRSVSSISLSSYSISRASSIEALHRAALLAKIDVVYSLQQSTLATAMKYTCDRLRTSRRLQVNILVMNIRNNGCRCSLFQISEGTIFPIGSFSGSYDKLSIDNYLAELLRSNFYANHGEITEEPNSLAKMRLLRIAEAAREKLMSSRKVKIFLESFLGALDLNVHLHQSQLETIVHKHVIPEVTHSFERLLSNLRFSKGDINKVICFGELTRMSDVHESILKEFNKNTKVEGGDQSNKLTYPVLGSSLCSTYANRREPIGKLQAIDVHYTNIAFSIHTRDDQEIMATIFRTGSSLPAREVFGIGIADQNGEGMLLRFFDMGEFKTEKKLLLFEIAVPFPVDMSLYDRNRHWQLGLVSNKSSRLANISVSNERSGALIEIDRSPSGLSTIKSGYCVPITPRIRQKWHIMKYLMPERSSKTTSHAIAKPESSPSPQLGKSIRRRPSRVLNLREATTTPSPPPEKISRRHSRGSREIASALPDEMVKRRSSRRLLDIDKAAPFSSPTPDRSFKWRSHSSRELREAAPSSSSFIDNLVKRRSHSSRELREVAPPLSPPADKPRRRRSSRRVVDVDEELPIQ